MRFSKPQKLAADLAWLKASFAEPTDLDRDIPDQLRGWAKGLPGASGSGSGAGASGSCARTCVAGGLIGVDVETAKNDETALVQLATRTRAVLFRLQPLLAAGAAPALAALQVRGFLIALAFTMGGGTLACDGHARGGLPPATAARGRCRLWRLCGGAWILYSACFYRRGGVYFSHAVLSHSSQIP